MLEKYFDFFYVGRKRGIDVPLYVKVWFQDGNRLFIIKREKRGFYRLFVLTSFSLEQKDSLKCVEKQNSLIKNILKPMESLYFVLDL